MSAKETRVTVRRALAAAVALASVAACGGPAAPRSAPTVTVTVTSTAATSPPATVSSAPAPSTSDASAPAPSAEPTQVAPAVTFDRSMVRWSEVVKQNKGGQANVHVVAGTTSLPALEQVAQQCVKDFLTDHKAAFCHVWGTDQDYAARDPNGAGDTLCWLYYVGVPPAGGDPVVTTADLSDLEIEHCPGAGTYS